MSLEDEIKDAIQEEEQSVLHYMKMVYDARRLGLLDEAGMLKEIADDERRHADVMRRMSLGRSTLAPGEYYWEVVNNDTGEILQHHTAYTTVSLAVQYAKDHLRTDFSHYANNALVIKVFTGSPTERMSVPYDVYPAVYTENYYMVGEAWDAVQPTGGRPLPQTYGDWVNLGMDIKEKAGMDDYETTAQVNRQLEHIFNEDSEPSAAQLSKRWLSNKATELGIT